MTDLKITPLNDWHRSHGGKLVPFAGWELPVQYSGVVAEHQAVRESAGLFDVSHMGELVVRGKGAQAYLQHLTCNDVGKLVDGKAQYNALINERGGVIDDIIVYRFSADHYFICVNASNSDLDYQWCKTNLRDGVTVENVSAQYGQIAIQGPKARSIVARQIPSCLALEPFHFGVAELGGVKTIIARTGYTGEDGFELFVPWNATEAVWEILLREGAPEGLIPCGLGARDSLRLEACYPLHGHELSPEVTALESGLGWIVKPEKGPFIGAPILSEQKAKGSPRALIGFVIDDPGIARQGNKVYGRAGQEIGEVTSGTIPPTVKKAVGLALVRSDEGAVGNEIAIEVRGKRLKAHVVKRPFYSRANR